jgi:hypothetical protein
MSQRAHFWLRIAGFAVILVLEFGPRVWTGSSPMSSGRIAAATAR